ncbi:DUF2169 family type VI secretion system accessory protein [Polyangium aurulentum]|uniref:DUF2169 family type VI secretion system accessory protein n=1 Tax=Polyangium aurulentum TaxID=2567896 RepID=UPI00146EFE10|nr:DUF2169 domain-containing protein [Polyangium aurulentum]UQA56659.1 DUF2169 domain-containing protein [Polyangium aurulentum]
MEIVRLCPFSVATVVWGDRSGAWNLSIGVKATFTLVHGEQALLAPRQDTAHGDISWDHNPQASLYAPSDFCPPKPRTDILFSGRAYAPGGTPTESVIARFRVGQLAKALRVTGPRVWLPGGGANGLRPSAPERFIAVPLRYEIAEMRGENMSGVQVQGAAPGSPLPRIECVDEPCHNQTPGLGPLPIRWRAAARGVEPAALAFARRLRTEHAPAPDCVPPFLFNAAPTEQQLDELEPAPPIILENLHRKVPLFETRLPQIRPRVFYAQRRHGKPEEVDVRLDTIWIDGLRMVAVVSWRGTTQVSEPEEQALGRIIVASESPEMTVSAEDIESPPDELKEDSNPRPMLPKPFEGEIAEDEGYTLLPTTPVREQAETTAEGPARAPSGMPPRPRDSSMPIPPSGERAIESWESRDRESMVLVKAPMLPGPEELAPRGASIEENLPGTARTGSVPPPSEGISAAPDSAPPPTIATGAAAPDSAPPPTIATGARMAPPISAVPVTPRTAEPTPPTITEMDLDIEAPPLTQRAPSLSWGEPVAARPFAADAALFAAPPETVKPSAIHIESVRASMNIEPARSSLNIEPVRSSLNAEPVRASGGERRRPSTPSFAALAFPMPELPIEMCAAMAARIDRTPEAREAILAEMGLSLHAWASTSQYWTSAIRTEVEQGRTELLLTYDRAYVDQIELERGVLDVEDYTRLMVSVERSSDADVVLAEQGVPRAALVRIERVWLQRMQADPAFGARVRQALTATRRAISRAQIRAPGDGALAAPRSNDR